MFALRLSPVNVKEITWEFDCCTPLADPSEHNPTARDDPGSLRWLLGLRCSCPLGWKAVCLRTFPGSNCLWLWKMCCGRWRHWRSLPEASGLLVCCPGLGLASGFLFYAVCCSFCLFIPQQTHLWSGSFVSH